MQHPPRTRSCRTYRSDRAVRGERSPHAAHSAACSAAQSAPVLSALALSALAACDAPLTPTPLLGARESALTAYCEALVTGVGVVSVEDDYLPRVVSCENGGAPLEALKAQAVAARSYLYYKLDRRGEIADGQ